MIKAIIFDMDGVLIEAKDWHYDALNRALNIFGYHINRHDHLTKFDGLPTKDKLDILSAEYSLPVELHSFINEMKQRYTMEIVHTSCKPMFMRVLLLRIMIMVSALPELLVQMFSSLMRLLMSNIVISKNL